MGPVSIGTSEACLEDTDANPCHSRNIFSELGKEKWQPLGKGTSLAISLDLACPTLPSGTIENTGEIRRLSNGFDGAEISGFARRVDQNGNWNRAR